MKVNIRQLAVLPFRLDREIDVLLVTSGPTGWRLPCGPVRKGMTQHESAALEARRHAGISGRIYKRPLSLAKTAGLPVVFPLLVTAQKHDAADGPPLSRWFPIQDAANLVDESLKPAFEDLAKRLGRSQHAFMSAAQFRRRCSRAGAGASRLEPPSVSEL